ncbi:MAG: hypothetical protein KKE20_02600 [Nanoarchaeota archaeon]|nr:hypothetical protein [Nanoarchaeota archaeon]
MSAIKERIFDRTSMVFLFCMLFYLIQALLALFFKSFPPLFDLFASVLLLGFAYLLHIQVGFRRTVPIFLAIGLFFNVLGLYSIIPYNEFYIGNLYGAPQLGYHYDWIAHSIGFGFFALAFSSVSYPFLRKAFRSNYTVFIFILLAMMGFGAINEINEFLGFNMFGIGEGFMEFGAGDQSPLEGPWENACMDLVNNLLGGIIFIGAFVIDKHYNLFSRAFSTNRHHQ